MFRPLDTSFFRDGTPYNAGEAGVAGPESCFPPSMNTIQGAIRTALALGVGWTPGRRDKWPLELGDSDHLGSLDLSGPYILRTIEGGLRKTEGGSEEVLYPAPFVLLKKELPEKEPSESVVYTRLVPGEKVMCDLFEEPVRLPVPRDKIQGLKPMDGSFLTKKGIEAVLAGDVPTDDDVVPWTHLWANEPRVGIELNRMTRTAQESMLYTSVHTRLHRGVRIAVKVAGIPEEWHDRAERVVRFGGEGRVAEIEVAYDRDLLPLMPELRAENGMLRFTVTLITPGWFGGATERVIKAGPPGVPGRCVCACIGKLQQIGGWDIVNSQPKPLRPVIPAGSTWFYEADGDKLDEVMALHGKRLGERAEYGYSQVIIGRWEEGR